MMLLAILVLASLFLFVFSLIAPSKGLFFMKKENRTRKKSFLYLLLFFFILMVSGAVMDSPEMEAAKKGGFATVEEWNTAKAVNATTAKEYDAYLKNKAEEEKVRQEAEAEKLRKEKEEEAIRLAEEEKICRENAKCTGEKHSLYIEGPCSRAIVKLAKYDYEWTDGLMTPSKFTHVQWKDKKKKILLLAGDKLKLQNGFGAWQVVSYLCEYDVENKQPLSVEIQEDRLP